MTDLVRICPNCGSERPATEVFCQADYPGGMCNWSLYDVQPTTPGIQEPTIEPMLPEEAAGSERLCVNGHPVSAGDLLCPICGADIASDVPEPPRSATVIDGWRVVDRLDTRSSIHERFVVVAEDGKRQALLTLYQARSEPDIAILETLRRQPLDHVPEILGSGRWNDQAYDVMELITGGSLQDLGYEIETLHHIVDEIGKALASFAEIGLRHRDIRPGTILVRRTAPLDLVITGFGSARLSDFDLDIVSPLELTRYSAPETIVGGVSAASDWWSLGMILLERVTQATCFAGVNEQAFMIHVITRGVSVPANLDPAIRQLLRGLLTRDPVKRWQWPQVRRWLSGEDVDVAPDPFVESQGSTGPAIVLGSQSYTKLTNYALAAAEAQHWDAAKDMFLRGSVSTWLAEAAIDNTTLANVRRIQELEDPLAEDHRHALALMAMNPMLPLILRGEIVSPAWLMKNPVEGYELITGPVCEQLRRMEREVWLYQLRDRAERVRERARTLEIELDEERFQVVALATSRANLDAEWAARRRLFPDTDHAGLASLIERRRITDDDLVLLLSAALTQFEALDPIIAKAEEVARHADMDTFDYQAARTHLATSRRDMYREIDRRVAGFARCGNPIIDAWGDTFRVERRLPLPRALALLAIPEAAWTEPPRQQYVEQILQFFEKRAANVAQRGPLVRLLIGKMTPRVDVTEVGSAQLSADSLLQRLLERTGLAASVSLEVLRANPTCEIRLRRLVSHASTYRRDTGIDGLYLGFPFLVYQDNRAEVASRVPRIAPILLWPIRIEIETGVRAPVKVSFDKEREEVRLNPAFDGLFGLAEAQRWREALRDLLEQSSVNPRRVVEAFAQLATPREFSLSSLPNKDFRVAGGTREIVCAAVFFHAEFAGQAISEDLRQLQGRPPEGTALETALRVNNDLLPDPDLPEVTEHGRFFIAESDPSQEAAVLKARQGPGLVIEGPPGTGKSQTIVNMVSDCIGRGETVLIVCQKLPALQVVAKRLRAEGLSDRFFMITDVNKERQPIVQALRQQLQNVLLGNNDALQAIRKQREDLTARIETVQRDIDEHHQALHQPDAETGLSYRTLIGELLAIEASGPFADTPALRALLGTLDRRQLSAIEEACSPLSPLWLAAHYEHSPLAVLKPFAADAALIADFIRGLHTFLENEETRDQVTRRTLHAFDVDDPRSHEAWLDEHTHLFRTMDATTRQNLAKWFDVFNVTGTETSRGQEAIDELEALEERLGGLNASHHDAELFSVLAELPLTTLRQWFALAQKACTPSSCLSWLNPVRLSSRHKLRKVLAGLGEPTSIERMMQLRDAVALEKDLRPPRDQFLMVARKFCPDVNRSSALALREARRLVSELLAVLRPIANAMQAVAVCPRRADAEEMIRSATTEAFDTLIVRYNAAFERWKARETSLASLNNLRPWIVEPWIDERLRNIEANRTNMAELDRMRDALPTTAAYQEFRTRAQSLSREALTVFAELRTHQQWLEMFSAEALPAVVRRILAREARLSWKGRMEKNHPVLLVQRAEIEHKVCSLESWDREMHGLNRHILAAAIDRSQLGPRQQWQSLTLLRGPNARRLREVIALGSEMGLMHLRPVWLMIPDVASRLLPLKAGLFDVVIFDEASQMPVEHALPALYRAKRMVISGDEKQMPPSSFFLSRIESDEEEVNDDDEINETATEAERTELVDAWNRREIKDCTDLLALGSTVLPRTMLEIHYRSQYRELIAFSNAAYYNGKLHIPVQHPDSKVRHVRPIEVLRVNGTYASQTNEGEARRVVRVLALMWKKLTHNRPSIGVVTFNRKQADLIEDLIEARAERDAEFRGVLREEIGRQQNGEDMSFFVKNVENVQGDERDVIIFSSTFGRDSSGTFRRSFGVLGQSGGERRLNVAITRARRKVVLITSLPIGEISDMLATGRRPQGARDYLQAYFDYVVKVSDGDLATARRTIQHLVTDPTGREPGPVALDEGLVNSVAAHIESLGFSPLRLGRHDAFGLDLAIEHPGTGLFAIGIECDAPQHPFLAKARYREIWRPTLLKRAVPHLHRVTSRSWYQQSTQERQRLQKAIETALS